MKGMISWRVRPLRDDLPGGNARLSSTLKNPLGGVEGCPSAEEVRLGMVWWEDFHEEESEGLLPVLHLGSDWPSSPSDAPYKHHVCPLKGCLRHPG